jgi:hypothetical protein
MGKGDTRVRGCSKRRLTGTQWSVKDRPEAGLQPAAGQKTLPEILQSRTGQAARHARILEWT